MLLNLKRWYPSECNLGGHVITMEVRRPERSEARAIARLIGRMGIQLGIVEKVGKEGGAQLEQGVEAQDRLFEAVESEAEGVKRWFKNYVRNVGGVDVDGEAITTGEQLYEELGFHMGLITFVVFRLQALATITVEEAKASASRSTSASDGGQNAGGSPATSTEREAGTEASTAEPTSVGD